MVPLKSSRKTGPSFKLIDPLLNLLGLSIRDRNRLMVLQDLLQFIPTTAHQAFAAG